MEDHALVFICQERGDGSRVLEEAVRLWPDGGVDHLGRPEHDLQWNAAGPGLFGLVEKGTLRFGDLEVTVEPVLPVHIGVGTGYGFDGDGWKHGTYQGELEVAGQGLGPVAPTRAEAPCSASSTPSPGSSTTARPAGASSSGSTSDAYGRRAASQPSNSPPRSSAMPWNRASAALTPSTSSTASGRSHTTHHCSGWSGSGSRASAV